MAQKRSKGHSLRERASLSSSPRVAPRRRSISSVDKDSNSLGERTNDMPLDVMTAGTFDQEADTAGVWARRIACLAT